MTETLKKLDKDTIEITTTKEGIEVDLFTREKLLRAIAKSEETIAKNKRWLAELDKTS